jgi:hypothetical protein
VTQKDEPFRELLSRFVVVCTPEFESRYPYQWGARVTVPLRDGDVLTGHMDHLEAALTTH